MPPCRKCGKNISYLIDLKRVYTTNYMNNKDGKKHMVTNYRTVTHRYYCHMCHKLIYRSEKKAEEFLGIGFKEDW